MHVQLFFPALVGIESPYIYAA